MLAVLLSETGCQSVKSTFGFDHQGPDELQVVPLAPLALPQDFNKTPSSEKKEEDFVKKDGQAAASKQKVEEAKPKDTKTKDILIKRETLAPESFAATDLLFKTKDSSSKTEEGTDTKVNLVFENIEADNEEKKPLEAEALEKEKTHEKQKEKIAKKTFQKPILASQETLPTEENFVEGTTTPILKTEKIEEKIPPQEISSQKIAREEPSRKSTWKILSEKKVNKARVPEEENAIPETPLLSSEESQASVSAQPTPPILFQEEIPVENKNLPPQHSRLVSRLVARPIFHASPPALQRTKALRKPPPKMRKKRLRYHRIKMKKGRHKKQRKIRHFRRRPPLYR